MKTVILLLCAALAFPVSAAAFTVSNPRADANGVVWYDAVSAHNGPGPTILRVLAPTAPAGVAHRFIYVLPTTLDVDLEDFFGDGLEELRKLNVHNDYNAHIIAPSFKVTPWYADHASDPERRYETFLVQHLVAWVNANLAVSGVEDHWLVGFSKSGFGAINLLFRNPTVFDAAAAWDVPAEQADTNDWDLIDNLGTEANFQANYRLTDAWVGNRKGPFQATPRLWLSHDYVTHLGVPTFLEEVSAFAGRLQDHQVQFVRTGGQTRTHDWMSGWLSEAVASLHDMRRTARDDFNRGDGGLGSGWVSDPQWGSGGAIVADQVSSPVSNGGAFFWTADDFGPDQFSQIRLTGAVTDWVGVAVRGGVSPARGYWLAVKADGVHLYSFVNGQFHVLVHEPTAWSTGDTLRLEVRTIAPGTARLTVIRNGTMLFSHADATYFIAGGWPGIGLFASGAVALDDWRGGEISGAPAPPPLGALSARDDFNRADGGVGPAWMADPQWGDGASIVGNQITSPAFNGGALFWTTNPFGADQYSEISITGAIGDWVGVAVRGKVAPAQGYWLAVKHDGAYLYAYVNGQFHVLHHDPSLWSTGDRLRLEVQTIAPATARLTVYRNGNVLVTHTDGSTFIGEGQPGVGLFAGTAIALDDWRGGELTAAPGMAADAFDREDGSLGANWTTDPTWGSGATIMGQQVGAPLFDGGALFWTGTTFGADQFSQVRISGAIGDWVGVAVRGTVSPRHGYWLAVKADGAYLYAVVHGVFFQLAHDPTVWSTGDTVRLEVRTMAATTARLTVMRNGVPLMIHDETSHFIGAGWPGIGLYASTAVALDDWEGGALP